MDTVDLEQLPDSRERAGALVLWLSCEGQTDVWAVLDGQGLQVAAPIDLRTKKAERFSPQLIQGFWQKLKETESQDCCDVPDCLRRKTFKKDEMVMATVPFVYGRGSNVQILGGKHFLFFRDHNQETSGG